MINVTHSIILVAIMTAVTAGLRFAPFVVFSKSTPKVVDYFGEVLPFAIMGMLVVYCQKNVSLFTGTHGLPELVCIVLVALLHKWKHNTLLSILVGTIAYMVLIQSLG